MLIVHHATTTTFALMCWRMGSPGMKPNQGDEETSTGKPALSTMGVAACNNPLAARALFMQSYLTRHAFQHKIGLAL
jgi:hypothetical protein